jgi:hypothetical protein
MTLGTGIQHTIRSASPMQFIKDYDEGQRRTAVEFDDPNEKH